MCSLVISLCSRDVITIHSGSRLAGLTCSNAPGFWMEEHQLVIQLALQKVHKLRKNFTFWIRTLVFLYNSQYRAGGSKFEVVRPNLKLIFKLEIICTCMYIRSYITLLCKAQACW